MNAKQETAVPVTAKVKLTLCKDERFFGPGVCELLEGIRETGSIQAAAARMEMSYTKAWRILKRAEEEMGLNLITRVTGGKKGGSSTLTEAGKKITHDLNDFIADAFKYVSGSIPKADLEVFYRTLFTISENLFSFADQLAAGQVTG